MDDQQTLEQATKLGIIKDLEGLGVVFTRPMHEALAGRVTVALAMSYQQGWRAALLRVLGNLNQKATAPTVQV